MLVFNKSSCVKDKQVISNLTTIHRGRKITKKITKNNKAFLRALGFKL